MCLFKAGGRWQYETGQNWAEVRWPVWTEKLEKGLVLAKEYLFSSILSCSWISHLCLHTSPWLKENTSGASRRKNRRSLSLRNGIFRGKYMSLMKSVGEDRGALSLPSATQPSLGTVDETELAATQLSTMNMEDFVAPTELSVVLVQVTISPGLTNSKVLWVCQWELEAQHWRWAEMKSWDNLEILVPVMHVST